MRRGDDLIKIEGFDTLRFTPTCVGKTRYPRSIPACTGEPLSFAFIVQMTTVYPRVYGGTPHTTNAKRIKYGLSPRVRGNRDRAQERAFGVGSIPACTGEPAPIRRPAWVSTVYPRVYGGTDTEVDDAVLVEGLSPRVRGNHCTACGEATFTGSIPAFTGEPETAPSDSPAPRVYPRVYGGTSGQGHTCLCLCGLSPRVRGNLSGRRVSF